MGTEFNELFDAWAYTYDAFVAGEDEQYKEAFMNYDEILKTVARKAIGTVLEFGVGTGNLTEQLLQEGHIVYGVEPSHEMRKIAEQKLLGKAKIIEGDFLDFAVPDHINTIVSTYAFHHLTDDEKNKALQKYSELLKKGDKIVFADTIFIDQEAYNGTVQAAIERGYHHLAHDLQTEYYTLLPIMRTLFENNGFSVTFTRYNHYVWVMEAVKN